MKKIIFVFILLSHVKVFAAVTWQKQAEKLQKISVSLLEAIPVSTPIKDNIFDLYGEIAILPKPSSKVGSK